MTVQPIIDPIGAIIALLCQDADLNALVAGQVAEKHKFALPETDPDRWPNPSKALTVRDLGGGAIDLTGGVQHTRIEARCYGESALEAKQVELRLVRITHTYDRTVVQTDNGKAFIYWLLLDDSPSTNYDPDLDIDVATVTLRAAVAEDPVP